MSSDHLPRIFITADEDKVEESSSISIKELLDNELKDVTTSGLPRVAPAIMDQKDAINSQLDNSALQLVTVLRDGNELVSNVIVAGDRQEITRRMKEAELREDLLMVLQHESNVALEKFKDISKCWKDLDEVRDPFNMNLGLEEQKLRIAELMKQKDEIIAECRKELQKADENYYRDQEKHSEDLECLVDRINSHVETMKQAYSQELCALQITIDQERNRIRGETGEAWNELFGKKLELENLKLEEQKVKLISDDKDLERLVLEHEELIRATKIRLEVDNDCLQIELQKTKANVLLNTQKLDYNFEVLKRREEESVRNQQKKRLTKMYDNIAILRRSLKEMNTKNDLETNKLRTDITKLKSQIKELESSAMVFTEANDLKYKKIWEMNEEECLTLANQIKVIDADISKNELGASSMPQNPIELLHITDLPSFKRIIEINDADSVQITDDEGAASIEYTDCALKNLLDQVIDKTGFIHEDLLLKILQPLKEPDVKLIKFSNFLNLFKIKEEQDLEKLLSVFKKYMWCENCTSPMIQCTFHSLVIDPDDILPALFELRLKLQNDDSARTGTSQSANEKSVIDKESLPRMIDPKEVALFWKQFEDICSPELDQLWTGLEYGLKEYLVVLRQRESLFGECEQLRLQNAELNRLLENHK